MKADGREMHVTGWALGTHAVAVNRTGGAWRWRPGYAHARVRVWV